MQEVNNSFIYSFIHLFLCATSFIYYSVIYLELKKMRPFPSQLSCGGQTLQLDTWLMTPSIMMPFGIWYSLLAIHYSLFAILYSPFAIYQSDKSFGKTIRLEKSRRASFSTVCNGLSFN